MRALNITGQDKGLETVSLSKREREALRTFVEGAYQSLGENLVRIILFGSKARGQAKRGSDLDLLIILRNRNISAEKRTIERVVETELHYNIYRLSPVIYSVEDYEARKKMGVPFISEVEADGVILE